MSERCKWLHEQLELLPKVKFPFKVEQLSDSGIYFFYEQGENSDHGSGIKLRIVRVGISREGNLRARISEHFLLNESKMNFTRDTAKPADRSVFRLNIGKALLNKANDDYLKIWNIDFTNIVYKSVGSNNMQPFSSALWQRWVTQEHFTAPGD